MAALTLTLLISTEVFAADLTTTNYVRGSFHKLNDNGDGQTMVVSTVLKRSDF